MSCNFLSVARHLSSIWMAHVILLQVFSTRFLPRVSILSGITPWPSSLSSRFFFVFDPGGQKSQVLASCAGWSVSRSGEPSFISLTNSGPLSLLLALYHRGPNRPPCVASEAKRRQAEKNDRLYLLEMRNGSLPQHSYIRRMLWILGAFRFRGGQ